jgi:AcrR family transcriptional regulator
MARRGDALRDHILWTAKDVFLEMGYERASMDVVAARAQTSKRSLYAHFESKEQLFLAVIEFVRDLFLDRLRTPGDYSDKPVEALTLFCARYLEVLMYGASIQMLRVTMAEIARFPEGAARHYEVMFGEVQARVSAYLKSAFALSPRASVDAAQKLLGQLTYPRLLRALFGMEKLAGSLDSDGSGSAIDIKPVRKAVVELIAELQVG